MQAENDYYLFSTFRHQWVLQNITADTHTVVLELSAPVIFAK